ncbi:Hpt domain-containing protein [Sphingomonas sp. 1P06PA]|uniref:Hpt domain-containing protein n=1 Tax=Sphingomonas sp. 1P06PA TaxID=554121 RepID=UPI0039A408C7
MAYEPQGLDAMLAAAVGDDPALVNELRTAFAESARALAGELRSAPGDAEWRAAALRLQGLAASFGALGLMALAETALAGSAADRATLRRIDAFVDGILLPH